MGITSVKKKLPPGSTSDEKSDNKTPGKKTDTISQCLDEDIHRLVHELEVHQIELEMQNEELRQIRDALDASLEKYTDLYNFAPIGYFTLNRDGEIIFANLNGANLLGIDRSRLSGLSFSQLIAAEERPLFSKFMKNVFTSKDKQSCEFTINNQSESPLFVLIEAVVDPSGNESRIALIDITERKIADKKIVHLASFPLLNPNPVI